MRSRARWIAANAIALVWAVTVGRCADAPHPSESKAAFPKGIRRSGREYFVAPNGKPDGAGSKTSPWDMDSVMAARQPIQAGDVVWVRGGTYAGGLECRLSGAPDAPVILRRYPGEWARIDLAKAGPNARNVLTVAQPWVWIWGLELTDTSLDRRRRSHSGLGGVAIPAPFTKLINIVLHDCGNSSPSQGGVGTEIYGCIAYNNGADDNKVHNWYPQNGDADHPKVFEDCIDCNSAAYGLHMYSGQFGPLSGFTIAGCVTFNNGVSRIGPGERKPNILVGGVQVARRIVLRNNFSWAEAPDGRNWEFGYGTDQNEDITLADNYIVGSVVFRKPWKSITMNGNTIYGVVTGADPARYPNNTWLRREPKENRVFVRPNKYERGRGHVIVYNWRRQNAVPVSLSDILLPGETFEVRDGQNFLGSPVLRGVYDGKPVLLPMKGLKPAQPVSAPGAIEEHEQTTPAFNVFVVLSAAASFRGP